MVEHTNTLFQQLGGQNAVDTAVDKFYDRVLADDRINSFFEGIDMEKQRNHQKAFLTFAFGGTNQYNGQAMREAHQRLVAQLGMNDDHFNAVIENLVITLQEMGVSADLIQQVGKVANSIRGEVLNR